MEVAPRGHSFEDDACWVCLEGSNQSAGKLEHPCACPRGVHAKCLARWQLQSAGREEERFCRFCKHELPDWRDILTPKAPAAPPVMAIVYDGKVVRLQVKPGKEGMAEFQRQVRAAFNLGDDVELDCVFDCKAPGTGEKIKLRGLESYSAAMHCAAVAAGERLAKTATAASPAAGGSGSSAVGLAGSAAGAHHTCSGAGSSSGQYRRLHSGSTPSGNHSGSSSPHAPASRQPSLSTIPLNVAVPLPPTTCPASSLNASLPTSSASFPSSSTATTPNPSLQQPSLTTLPPIIHASHAAAGLEDSEASPRQPPLPAFSGPPALQHLQTPAACRLPSLGRLRREKSSGSGGSRCPRTSGGGSITPDSQAAAVSPRRGNLLSGLLKSLSAARRVM